MSTPSVSSSESEKFVGWVNSNAQYVVDEIVKTYKALEEESDDECWDLLTRIKTRRKLKRKFVDVTNRASGETVRIPFHSRKKQSRDALIEAVRDMINTLQNAGHRHDATVLRALGVGAETAKEALS